MAWIDSLFQRMVELGASDLHISSTVKPCLRLHGDMMPIEECPELQPDQMKQVLYEIAPKRNQEEFERDRDTDFAYEIEGLARFRVNMFCDRKGPGAVCRVIPADILTFEKLGLPQAVVNMCQLSKGLVLVTGPTGSGKSTTLAAMVDYINRKRKDHIITIEDPIEFVHANQLCLVNQREVGRHTESFKRALRAALREDPDIVLVGEMRDLETVEIAIETAETGHLVFGTLHTTTASSTVDRIIDQFPADRQAQIRTMLSTSLKGVVAQTLCKKQPTGRVAALEILVVNSAVSSQIREGKTHMIPNAIQMGGKEGMRLLNDSLVELVTQKTISIEEGYLKSVDKEGFKSRCASMGVPVNHLAAGPAPAASPAAAAPNPAASGGQPQAALPHDPAAQPANPALDPFQNFKSARKG